MCRQSSCSLSTLGITTKKMVQKKNTECFLTVGSGYYFNSRIINRTSVLLLLHHQSDSALQHLHREPRIDSNWDRREENKKQLLPETTLSHLISSQGGFPVSDVTDIKLQHIEVWMVEIVIKGPLPSSTHWYHCPKPMWFHPICCLGVFSTSKHTPDA